jgi:transcriptional regulator with XRE-family HTH domain
MDASQEIAIRNRIVGILVKRARLENGKSQRECAEFLGCSPSMFRNYERGRRGMSLPQLEALAYLFDMPVENLLDDSRPSSTNESEKSMPVEQIMLLRRKMLAVQFRQCRRITGMSQRKMGELLGCSASMISQYERGKRDIPLAELELAAERSGQGVAEFLDKQAMPLSQSEQERRALARLAELSPEVRDFVLNPTNALYFRIAMLLSAMKADSLRQIAETILDITY